MPFVSMLERFLMVTVVFDLKKTLVLAYWKCLNVYGLYLKRRESPFDGARRLIDFAELCICCMFYWEFQGYLVN